MGVAESQLSGNVETNPPGDGNHGNIGGAQPSINQAQIVAHRQSVEINRNGNTAQMKLGLSVSTQTSIKQAQRAAHRQSVKSNRNRNTTQMKRRKKTLRFCHMCRLLIRHCVFFVFTIAYFHDNAAKDISQNVDCTDFPTIMLLALIGLFVDEGIYFIQFVRFGESYNEARPSDIFKDDTKNVTRFCYILFWIYIMIPAMWAPIDYFSMTDDCKESFQSRQSFFFTCCEIMGYMHLIGFCITGGLLACWCCMCWCVGVAAILEEIDEESAV